MFTNAGALLPTHCFAPPRVVISGLGAVTLLALATAGSWAKLLAGEAGAGSLTRFDVTFDGEKPL